MLNDETKKKLAADLLKGLVQGIEYFEQNKAVFVSAHKSADPQTPRDSNYFDSIAAAFSELSQTDRDQLNALSDNL